MIYEIKNPPDMYDWKFLSRQRGQLTNTFMDKYFDRLDLHSICKFQNLSNYFIISHFDALPSNLIVKYQLKDHSKNKYWKYSKDCNIITSCRLGLLSAIFDRLTKWDISYICNNYILSDEFIREHFDKLDMPALISSNVISEDIIDEYWARFPLEIQKEAIIKQKLDESFIDTKWCGELIQPILSTNPTIDFINNHLSEIKKSGVTIPYEVETKIIKLDKIKKSRECGLMRRVSKRSKKILISSLKIKLIQDLINYCDGDDFYNQHGCDTCVFNVRQNGCTCEPVQDYQDHDIMDVAYHYTVKQLIEYKNMIEKK